MKSNFHAKWLALPKSKAALSADIWSFDRLIAITTNIHTDRLTNILNLYASSISNGCERALYLYNETIWQLMAFYISLKSKHAVSDAVHYMFNTSKRFTIFSTSFVVTKVAVTAFKTKVFRIWRIVLFRLTDLHWNYVNKNVIYDMHFSDKIIFAHWLLWHAQQANNGSVRSLVRIVNDTLLFLLAGNFILLSIICPKTRRHHK